MSPIALYSAPMSHLIDRASWSRMPRRTIFAAVLVASLLYASLAVCEEPDRFERALALYSEGPSRAPEIIELLRAELSDHPDHEKARRLLAITLFGTEQFEAALVEFDVVLAAIENREEISPRILFYKARTLYELKRYEEAAKILDVYWAFWQDDEKLRQGYEYYSERIKKRLEAESANKRTQTDGRT